MARDITKLHPILQCKVKELQDLCEKNKLKIGISECVRTVAEQDALYAKGRTAPGNIVTNAKGSTYSSMHMWSVAFDFYRNDGKGAYEDKDGFFTKVGKFGQSIGLEWGGSWKSIIDKPHFQLADWGSTTSKLKSLYGTPDKFMDTLWKVGKTYTLNTNSSLHKAADMKDTSKVKFDTIESTAMKNACKKNKDGYAIMQSGNKFTLKEMKICSGYIMGKTKSGHWIPLYYNGKSRI